MKKIFLLVLLGVIGVATWYFFETKPKPNNEVAGAPPVVPSSNTLSDSPVDKTLSAYYALSEAFVKWDSTAVQSHLQQLNQAMQDLEKDTSAKNALNGIRQKAENIRRQKDITAQRRAFNDFSQHFYTWLNRSGYKTSTVYLQECPMAFNDEEKGVWLSQTEAIRNPYLGLHHPKYKSGMLECGSVKDSIKNK